MAKTVVFMADTDTSDIMVSIINLSARDIKRILNTYESTSERKSYIECD